MLFYRYDKLTIKESDKTRTLKSCTSALITILHSWIGNININSHDYFNI